MVVMSSLQALQVGWLKRHEGTHILPLDPSIIHMSGTMISECVGNSFESSIHVFMVFTIQHIEPFGLVVQSFISISSHTLISNKYVNEGISTFLGGVKMLNVRHVLGSNPKLNHVFGSGVELTVNHFSSCQVAWVVHMKTIHDDCP